MGQRICLLPFILLVIAASVSAGSEASGLLHELFGDQHDQFLKLMFSDSEALSGSKENLAHVQKVFQRGVLGNLYQFYEENSTDRKSQCAKDIMALNLTELWTLKMIDANGKFPYGLLKGNLFSLGQFSECLSIDHDTGKGKILGKYCPVNIILPNILMSVGEALYGANSTTDMKIKAFLNDHRGLNMIIGACVPSSCTALEIMRAFQHGLNVTKPSAWASDEFCSVKKRTEPRKASEISAIVFFSIFAAVVVCSTLYDILTKFFHTEKFITHNALIAFSLYTNTQNLTKIGNSPGSLKCIHGIRSLSLLWLMLFHRYANAGLLPMKNNMDYQEWRWKYSAMIVYGGEFAVDSFFLLSGLLLAYVFLSQNENKKCFNIPLFYLHRFVRIWPAMATAMYLQTTIVPHMIHAPLWKMVSKGNREYCEANWWTSLLFVQNYVNADEMCLRHTWYLAVDMQMYVLSPILLLPLLKNRRIGLANLLFWIVLSQIGVITVAYMNDWGISFNTREGFWAGFYVPTHIRGSVWLLGFLGGYILYVCKNKQVKLNKVLVAFFWIVSLCVMWFVIFGGNALVQPDHEINKLQDNTYGAFVRAAWALALFWMVFACLKGYGGPVNWFLSLSVWEVLGRLSYSMYLLHVGLIVVQIGSMNAIPHFSNFAQIYQLCGDVIFSIIIAYFWVVTFELPFTTLERLLLHKKKSTDPPQLNLTPRINDK